MNTSPQLSKDLAERLDRAIAEAPPLDADVVIIPTANGLGVSIAYGDHSTLIGGSFNGETVDLAAAAAMLVQRIHREVARLRFESEPLTIAVPRRSRRERRVSAYHETGHAICALVLRVDVRSVTIRPARCSVRGQVGVAGGSVYLGAVTDLRAETVARRATISAVGPLTPSAFALEAYDDVSAMADKAHIDGLFDAAGLHATDREAAWDATTDAACTFLEHAPHLKQIAILAEALLDRESMTGDEVRALCAAQGVPIEPWTHPNC